MTDISTLGSIVGIWAHPDDETFMVGGMLSLAAKQGQAVACVTATKGEAGVQDDARWPADKLGAIRAEELAKALSILGVGNHAWLGYKDGQCKDVNEEEVITRLVEYIDARKPDSIITFPPDGLTGHDDHVAVSRWSLLAAERSQTKPKVWYAVHTQEAYDASFRALHNRFNIYFNIDMPTFVPMQQCDVVVSLDDKVLDTKLRALKAMPSQYEAFFVDMSDQEAALAFEVEGLIAAAKWEAL